MKLNEIIPALEKNHQDFSKYLKTLSKQDYEFSYEGKWNAGQHLKHINISVYLVAKVLGLPKWLLKYKFGKANRVSRTYDELFKRYDEKLKTAPPAPDRFQPGEVTFKERKQDLDKLSKHLNKLYKRSRKYNEKILNLYIIPHPLLGYLTIRELLYFTDFHVKIHKALVERDLIKN